MSLQWKSGYCSILFCRKGHHHRSFASYAVLLEIYWKMHFVFFDYEEPIIFCELDLLEGDVFRGSASDDDIKEWVDTNK